MMMMKLLKSVKSAEINFMYAEILMCPILHEDYAKKMEQNMNGSIFATKVMTVYAKAKSVLFVTNMFLKMISAKPTGQESRQSPKPPDSCYNGCELSYKIRDALHP